MNTTPIIKEGPNNNTNNKPANANKHISGPSDYLIFTAAERIVPTQYLIVLYKETACYGQIT